MHKAFTDAYLSTFRTKRANMPVSIGRVVKEYLKKEKGIGTSVIARDFQTTRQNIDRQLKQVDPNMSLIRRLASHYRVDLFQVISNVLREDRELIVKETDSSGYGVQVTRSMYDGLLQENLELHRDLREKTKELERLKAKLGANL